MYLTKEIKEEIFAQHGEKTNTGKLKLKLLCSLSELAITEHLKKNRHDYNTERSLVLLVGKKKIFLDYLKKKKSTDIVRLSKY
jgi:small subunit ribosomal protein S15